MASGPGDDKSAGSAAEATRAALIRRVHQAAVLLDRERPSDEGRGREVPREFSRRANRWKPPHFFALIVPVLLILGAAVSTLVLYLASRSDVHFVADYRMGPRYYDRDIAGALFFNRAVSRQSALLATRGVGVHVFERDTFFWRRHTRSNTRGGLIGDDVRRVAADNSGNLYFLCAESTSNAASRGLCRAAIAPNGPHEGLLAWHTLIGLSRFDALCGDSPATVTTVCRQGEKWWFGTNGGGIGEYDREAHEWTRVYRVGDGSGLPSDCIHDAAAAPGGAVYFATDRGIMRLVDEKWTHFSAGDAGENGGRSLVGADVRRVVWADGRLWYCTNGMGVGVLTLRDAEGDGADGLAGHRTVVSEGQWNEVGDEDVVAVVPGTDASSLWLADKTGSVANYRVQDRSWYVAPTVPGSPRINRMAAGRGPAKDEDAEESLWLASSSGVWRIRRGDDAWQDAGLSGRDVGTVCLGDGFAAAGIEGEDGTPVAVLLDDGTGWRETHGRGACDRGQGSFVGAVLDPGSGNIIVADAGGLSTYDSAGHKWLSRRRSATAGLLPGKIVDIAWHGGTLLHIVERGLLGRYSFDERKTELLLGGDGDAIRLAGITACDRDAEGRLWISSAGEGIGVYDPAWHRWQRLTSPVTAEQIVCTSSGTWMLARGAVYFADAALLRTGRARSCRQAQEVFRWIRGATDVPGVLACDQHNRLFLWRGPADRPRQVVGDAAPDLVPNRIALAGITDRVLLVAESGGVLHAYDRETRAWERHGSVKCEQIVVFGDSPGRPWIRTTDGDLCVYEPARGRALRIRRPSRVKRLAAGRGHCLAVTEEGSVWRFSPGAGDDATGADWLEVVRAGRRAPLTRDIARARFLACGDDLLVATRGDDAGLWRFHWGVPVATSWRRQATTGGAGVRIGAVRRLDRTAGSVWALTEAGRLLRRRGEAGDAWRLVASGVDRIRGCGDRLAFVSGDRSASVCRADGEVQRLLPPVPRGTRGASLGRAVDVTVGRNGLHVLTDDTTVSVTPDLLSWKVVGGARAPVRFIGGSENADPWLLGRDREADGSYLIYRMMADGEQARWQAALTEAVRSACISGDGANRKAWVVTRDGAVVTIDTDGRRETVVHPAPLAWMKAGGRRGGRLAAVVWFDNLYYVAFREGPLAAYDPAARRWRVLNVADVVQLVVVPGPGAKSLWCRTRRGVISNIAADRVTVTVADAVGPMVVVDDSVVTATADGRLLQLRPGREPQALWGPSRPRLPVQRITAAAALADDRGNRHLLLADRERVWAYNPDTRRWSSTPMRVTQIVVSGTVARVLLADGRTGLLRVKDDGIDITADRREGAAERKDGTGVKTLRLAADPAAKGRESLWVELREDGRVTVSSSSGPGRAAGAMNLIGRSAGWVAGDRVTDVCPSGSRLLVGVTGRGVRVYDSADGSWSAPPDVPVDVRRFSTPSADGTLHAATAGGEIHRFRDGAWRKIAENVDQWRASGQLAAVHVVPRKGRSGWRIIGPGREFFLVDPGTGPPVKDIRRLAFLGSNAYALTVDGGILRYDADLRQWAPVKHEGAKEKVLNFGASSGIVACATRDAFIVHSAVLGPGTARVDLDEGFAPLRRLIMADAAVHLIGADGTLKTWRGGAGLEDEPEPPPGCSEIVCRGGRLVCADDRGGTYTLEEGAWQPAGILSSRRLFLHRTPADRPHPNQATQGNETDARREWSVVEGRLVDEQGETVLGAPASVMPPVGTRVQRVGGGERVLWMEFGDGSLWSYRLADHRLERRMAAGPGLGIIPTPTATYFERGVITRRRSVKPRLLMLPEDADSPVDVPLPDMEPIRRLLVAAEGLLLVDAKNRHFAVTGRQVTMLAGKTAASAAEGARRPSTGRAVSSGLWRADPDAPSPGLLWTAGRTPIPIGLNRDARRLECDVVNGGVVIGAHTWLITNAGVFVYRTGVWHAPVAVHAVATGVPPGEIRELFVRLGREGAHVSVEFADGGRCFMGPTGRWSRVAHLTGRIRSRSAMTEKREDLRAAAADLDRLLDSWKKTGSQWRRFLLWDSLRAQLEDGAVPDGRLLSRILERFSGDAKGLERPRFLRVRRALARYTHESALPTLAESRDFGDMPRSPIVAEAVGAGKLRLDAVVAGETVAVTYQDGLFDVDISNDVGVLGEHFYRTTGAGLFVHALDGETVAALPVKGGLGELRVTADGRALFVRSAGKTATWYHVTDPHTIKPVAAASVPGAGEGNRTFAWLGRTWRCSIDDGGFVLTRGDAAETWNFNVTSGRFRRDCVRDVAVAGNHVWMLTDAGLVGVDLGSDRLRPKREVRRRVAGIDTRSLARIVCRRRESVAENAGDADHPRILLGRDGVAVPISPATGRSMRNVIFQGVKWRVSREDDGKTESIAVRKGNEWADLGFSRSSGLASDNIVSLARGIERDLWALTPVALLRIGLRDGRTSWFGPRLLPPGTSFGRADRVFRAGDDSLWLRFGSDAAWCRFDVRTGTFASLQPLPAKILAERAGLCGVGPMRWSQPGDGPPVVMRVAADGSTMPLRFTEDGRLDADVILDAVPSRAGLWLATAAGLQCVRLAEGSGLLSCDARREFTHAMRLSLQDGVAFARTGSGTVFRRGGGTWRETVVEDSPFRLKRRLACGILRAVAGADGVAFSLQPADGEEIPVALAAGGGFDFQYARDIFIRDGWLAVRPASGSVGLWTMRLEVRSGPGSVVARSETGDGEFMKGPAGACWWVAEGGEALRLTETGKWIAGRPPKKPDFYTVSRRWRARDAAEDTGGALEVNFTGETFVPAVSAGEDASVEARGFVWQQAADVVPDDADGWWVTHAMGVSHYAGDGSVRNVFGAGAFAGALPDRLDVIEGRTAACAGDRWFLYAGEAWRQSADVAEQIVRRDSRLIAEHGWTWTRVGNGASASARLSCRVGPSTLPVTWVDGRFSCDSVLNAARCPKGGVVATRAGLLRMEVVGEKAEGALRTVGVVPAPEIAWSHLARDRVSSAILAWTSSEDIRGSMRRVRLEPGGGISMHHIDAAVRDQFLARMDGLYADDVWSVRKNGVTWRGTALRTVRKRFAHDVWRALAVDGSTLWAASAGGVVEMDLATTPPTMRSIGLAKRTDVLDIEPEREGVRAITSELEFRGDRKGRWQAADESGSDHPASAPGRCLVRTKRWAWYRRNGSIMIIVREQAVDAPPDPGNRLVKGRFPEDNVNSLLARRGVLYLATDDGLVRRRVGDDRSFWFRSGRSRGGNVPLGKVLHLAVVPETTDVGRSKDERDVPAPSRVLWAMDAGGRFWRLVEGPAQAKEHWRLADETERAVFEKMPVAATPFLEVSRRYPKGAPQLAYRNLAGAPHGPVLDRGRFVIDRVGGLAVHAGCMWLATPAGVACLDARSGDYKRLHCGAGDAGQGAAVALAPSDVLVHSVEGALFAVDADGKVFRLKDAEGTGGNAPAFVRIDVDDAWRNTARILAEDDFWRWNLWSGEVRTHVYRSARGVSGWPLWVDGRFSFDVVRDVRVDSEDLWLSTPGGIAHYRLPGMELAWLHKLAAGPSGESLKLFDAGRFLPGEGLRVQAAEGFYELVGDADAGWRWRAGRPAGSMRMELRDARGTWHVQGEAEGQGVLVERLNPEGERSCAARCIPGVAWDEVVAGSPGREGLWLCTRRGMYLIEDVR